MFIRTIATAKWNDITKDVKVVHDQLDDGDAQKAYGTFVRTDDIFFIKRYETAEMSTYFFGNELREMFWETFHCRKEHGPTFDSCDCTYEELHPVFAITLLDNEYDHIVHEDDRAKMASLLGETAPKPQPKKRTRKEK